MHHISSSSNDSLWTITKLVGLDTSDVWKSSSSFVIFNIHKLILAAVVWADSHTHWHKLHLKCSTLQLCHYFVCQSQPSYFCSPSKFSLFPAVLLRMYPWCIPAGPVNITSLFNLPLCPHMPWIIYALKQMCGLFPKQYFLVCSWIIYVLTSTVSDWQKRRYYQR